MASKVILAFDLYGTILSTASIAKQLAEYLGEGKATDVATTWRTLQLEYTWRLNSMQRYEPFSTVTLRSLIHALRQHAGDLSDQQIEKVMASYDSLSTFPDVAPALKALASSQAFHPLIFSNGTTSMLSNSVNRSSDLSPHASVFHALISADEIRRFKPDPAIYKMLIDKVQMKGQESKVWLISSNPFDVVGARAVGMQALWVNREQGKKSWEDNLNPDEIGRPTLEVSSLEHAQDKIRNWLNEHKT